MHDLFYYLLLFMFLKSTIIGSDFSFSLWIKYGNKYTNWYFNRPPFNPED